MYCKYHHWKDESDEVKEIFAKNPHIVETFQYGGVRRDIEFMHQMKEDYPRAGYMSRKGLCVSTIHHGQRKLLLTEIDFLTRYGHLSDTVLYVGAASGYHLNFLSSIFPHKFILVDPAPVGWQIEESERVTIISDFFTSEMAKAYTDILFICDIRNISVTGERGSDEEQEIVDLDMQYQKEWVEIMQPKASMLKFRLPWNVDHVEYLDGDIYFQPWTPPRSTETRLISLPPYTSKTYDCKEYEEKIAYFGRYARIAYYDHPYLKKLRSLRYDACYDCRLEIEIITDFLRMKVGREPNYDEVYEMLKQMNKASSPKRRI